jgi:hypothetical protein
MPVGEALYLKPKMGIVPEVSTQTYETLAKQFREVVTNSLDAGAKWVRISINPVRDDPYILFTDNGDGMSIEDLREQYLALGGSSRYYDENKIGRIGIGFLAVAPLCEYVEIYSRKKGSNKAFVARLELSKLLDKHLRLEEIKDFQVGEIVEEIDNAEEMGLESNYTKIYLKNVSTAVLNTFQDNEKFEKFENELRTILPLGYPEKCKLFNHISPELKDLLVAEASKTRIQVYLNSEKPLEKRVYGEEKGENFAYVMELKNEQCDGVKVLGYFVDNQAKIKDWNGLVTRVLNVAVEDYGFLGYEGHESAKPRVTGELFLVGIDKNKAISINRNKFNEGNEQFRVVQDFVHEKLRDFFQPHYTRSNIKSAVNKKVKQVKNIPLAIKRAEKGVFHLSKGITDDQMKKPLDSRKTVNPLKIESKGKYGRIATTFVPDLEDRKSKSKGYEIKWTGKNGIDAEVLIDKHLLESAKKTINIAGQDFSVVFVEASPSDKPCDIDFAGGKIILNDSSPLVHDKDDKLLLFVILTTYYHEISKDKDDFYRNLINSLLGAMT